MNKEASNMKQIIIPVKLFEQVCECLNTCMHARQKCVLERVYVPELNAERIDKLHQIMVDVLHKYKINTKA
jgi:hypothetical protein